ncbi:MAG: 23S rRNA (adenine(2503)-C(2))-methyltransferase @ tRNA (adenine(37)-C(2))-methyltransferase (EC [uncultured Paraburkholderia sp.]|uniref:radical SAM protein n=1 Tax=uncultured Paraburkholderia sp. TaxID=1822466 RepID=UPI00259611B2|nr:radical SAM protein [uncultured Paraburkholderia sp.]CAH2904430.1 MAG: 23S rRNA (adenine(2503)-C(2))-methyltransferase @ tRNA (adenine(37)-C(2))-methyltransferase (EC [uncultured Paraburkholderia sp.]CAH2943725.1 MAG: 23S rRNA (adenine(2503)-C(2))-methyltransferase @ tRNA (adenine(37)-C(2))-methyltransferase (EC [uncultured Paraburkholderia sp.]
MEIVERKKSADGGCKYLLATGDLTKTVESTLFYMDEPRLPYLCVSCQIGCAIGCIFCETGRQKPLGNLDSDQIIQQVKVCLNDLEQETNGEIRKINTVLFAGMGEPMLNLPEIKDATIAIKARGFAYRVTLTTMGIVSKFNELYEIPLDTLSISLHATTDEKRERLIPGGAKYRITDLIDHVDRYQKTSGARVIFNYLLLRDVNDTDEDLRRLMTLINPNDFVVKLKYLNEIGSVDGLKLKASDRFSVFANELRENGYECIVDISKGTDVWGGCGQLRSKSRTLRVTKERKECDGNFIVPMT